MIAQDKAETVALQALGWLAGNEELFPTFLGATGAEVADLATAARQPTFLAAVMDFLLMDDAWVMAFCDDTGLRYEVPMQARQMLPGGAQINWT
jgi:hypothetical protein